MSQRSVLIVDDEEELRGVIASEFMFKNWNTLEAANGNEALKILEKKEVDAVISDIRMPNGDGVFLSQEINRRLKKKPILIFISGFSDVDTEKSKELGAYKILQKPFRITDLVSVIEDAFYHR